MVISDVEKLMYEEWQGREHWTEYQRDRYFQWNFAEQKSYQYINHDGLFEEFIEFSSDNKILKIQGFSDCGKSTLMSYFAM